MIDILKCILRDNCDMNPSQVNLTLLSFLTIIIQGIGFYFIDKNKMNIHLFIFVIIFGLIYNIMYYKTYVN
jgi:hypothetical protein